MMNRAMWQKAVREAGLLWVSCAALLYTFCWVRVWITSQVDMTRFQSILENIPPSWQRLSPVPIEQLVSYPTRIAMTYEEPLVYLAIALWSVARSSDCVSGEIGRGTMEMLLAQPLSRLQAILAPSLVTIVGAALLALVAWGGTATGIATTEVRPAQPGWTIPLVGIDIPLGAAEGRRTRVPMRRLVDPRVFLPAMGNVFSLAFFLAGVGTLVSSWDRYRWRTIGIMVTIYVAEMIAEVVALAVEGWHWLKWFTFFSAYEPIAITSRTLGNPGYAWTWFQLDDQGRWTQPGPLGYDAVLIGLGIIGFLLGSRIFLRRDLPAPL